VVVDDDDDSGRRDCRICFQTSKLVELLMRCGGLFLVKCPVLVWTSSLVVDEVDNVDEVDE
jgi:hypothetical protein